MADYEVRSDRLYTETHEWVLVKGDIAEIGLSDFAAKELGDLVYVEAEPVDTEISKGDSLASVESVKMASDLYSPVDGTVVEINEEIEGAYEKINQTPYEAWISRIRLSDPEQLKDLMDAEAFQKFCCEG